MKILYATGRYSPLKHDEGSGEDFNLYHAFLRENFEVKIVGPVKDQADPVERLYRKLHQFATNKRYAKYSVALLRRAAHAVETASCEFHPDAIFSHNLSALVRLRADPPIIYLTDTTLLGTEAQWPLFSKVEFQRMLGWEKAVLNKSAHIITRSQWAIDLLINEYHVPSEKISLVDAAASLPDRVIPLGIDNQLDAVSPIKLLLVGRVYKLKGIDIAIEVVRQLNREGVKTELRIVGINGQDEESVHFMGSFLKADEEQLKAYAGQYQWAHFLIHPARYDSAPIVTTEAAAFGVPTLTNAVGGIATTVQDGVSGVVLPALSPAGEYTSVIRYYRDHPARYQALRLSTRARYERQLNWNVVGKRITGIIHETVAARQAAGRSENQ